MKFDLGDILTVNSVLTIHGEPFANQLLEFEVFRYGYLIESAEQYTDEDGEASVAFDTGLYQSGDYQLSVTWIVNNKKLLTATKDFELVDAGVILTLTNTSTSNICESGQTIVLQCAVTTDRGTPKNNVTITLQDKQLNKSWVSVTNSQGIAMFKIDTKSDDELVYHFTAIFGGTESDEVVIEVIPKIVLELRANASMYNAGEEATFTANLTKGGNPYPDQDITFKVE